MDTPSLSRNSLEAHPRLIRPSLREISDRVAADAGLPKTRRQNELSALRTLARGLGKPLEQLTSDPGSLCRLIEAARPARVGISRTRWANVTSLLRRILQRYALATQPARHCQPLAPSWQIWADALPNSPPFRALNLFFQFASDHGVAPADVDDAAMERFRIALLEDGIIKNARERHRRTCQIWNEAVKTIPDWPGKVVAVPVYRKPGYTLPWETYPPSFRHDVEAFLASRTGDLHQHGIDRLLDKEARRPLRPATIQRYRKFLQQFAGALVASGVDPGTITRLLDLVTPEHIQYGLRFLLDRTGGQPSSQLANIACLLKVVAEEWVGAPSEVVDYLATRVNPLKPKYAGLTAKNRERLRPFLDPAHCTALVSLPDRLCRWAERMPSGPTAALLVQRAVAIGILLMCPMRIKNLAGLRLDTHVKRIQTPTGETYHIIVPGNEVKNSVDLEFEMPAEIAVLLDLYLAKYRLLLTGEGDALFPGQHGRVKDSSAFGYQIRRQIEQDIGLTVNPHLFRHLGAMLFLAAHPGEYETVRRVLGHKSLTMTVQFYAGMETRSAHRRFDEHILSLGKASASHPVGRRYSRAPE